MILKKDFFILAACVVSGLMFSSLLKAADTIYYDTSGNVLSAEQYRQMMRISGIKSFNSDAFDNPEIVCPSPTCEPMIAAESSAPSSLLWDVPPPSETMEPIASSAPVSEELSFSYESGSGEQNYTLIFDKVSINADTLNKIRSIQQKYNADFTIKALEEGAAAASASASDKVNQTFSRMTIVFSPNSVDSVMELLELMRHVPGY